VSEVIVHRRDRVISEELAKTLARGKPSIGLAWAIISDLLPPGWDLVSMLRHGWGDEVLWTATASPVTAGAFSKVRKAGLRPSDHKQVLKVQGQSKLPADALLRLAVLIDQLPDALWERTEVVE